MFKSKTPNKIFLVLFMTTLMVVFGKTPVFSYSKQNKNQDGLFHAADVSDYSDLTDDPSIIRGRYVFVNFDLLETGSNLYINLFDDLGFAAEFDRVEHISQNSLSYNGRLVDHEYGEVNLIVRDGLMAGNIKLPDSLYQIRYISDGLHAIYEIDQAAFPPELKPIPVNQPDLIVKSTEAFEGDDGSAIDLLVVYTESARVAVGGTFSMRALIDLAVAETNQGYINSDIDQRVNLVHSAEVNYSEAAPSYGTTLERLQSPSDGYMDVVHSLREVYRADHVVLLINNSTYCGLAYLMTIVGNWFEAWAFSVVLLMKLDTIWDPTMTMALEGVAPILILMDIKRQTNHFEPSWHIIVREAVLE
jgi:hypothetical protein